MKQHFTSEQAFVAWVESLYDGCHQSVRVIFLQGPLGAGKSTFARAWLRKAGIQGRIKSPSFSIVETYASDALGDIHHIDCYRMQTIDDLRVMGIADYLDDCLLVEWPEKGFYDLIRPDLIVHINVIHDSVRDVVCESCVPFDAK